MERGSSSSSSVGNVDNADMFAKLTSHLLVLIVSFLPFKEAVRTSVLCKQWRDVWRQTKTMEFDEKSFVRRDEPNENRLAQRGEFVNFVRQFIANFPRTEVWKFSISISRPQDYLPDINQFINFAVSRGVKDLELDFSDPAWDENDVVNPGQGFELPQEVYQHGGNLESLKLYWCNLDVSRFNSLQAVGALSLGWTNLSLDQLRSLLTTCPMLETVNLKRCRGLVALDLSVPGSRLKNLLVDKCTLGQDYVLIDGPYLKSFSYCGEIGQFYLEDQRELVEASLDFQMEAQFEESGILLYELVEQLFSVQVMTVCSVLLQIIPTGDEPLRTKAALNVRHLSMNTALHPNEFIGIKFMLASCPRMNTLTLNLGPRKIFTDYVAPYPFDPQSFWSETAVVETCLRQNLRVVNVRNFKGTPNEMKVIKYIINFGRVLRRVNLYLPIEEQGDNNVAAYMASANLLVQAPRASQNLQIAALRAA